MRIITSKSLAKMRELEENDVLNEFQDLLHVDNAPKAPKFAFPTVYIVHKKNPFVKQGKFVRWFQEGYEECVVESPKGKLKIIGYTGLVIAHSDLDPFITAIKRRGLDRGAARQDRRRTMEKMSTYNE